jgi:TPR repeat protein
MYDRGQGVEQDDEKAVYWYEKAAEQGHGKAQLTLSVR